MDQQRWNVGVGITAGIMLGVIFGICISVLVIAGIKDAHPADWLGFSGSALGALTTIISAIAAAWFINKQISRQDVGTSLSALISQRDRIEADLPGLIDVRNYATGIVERIDFGADIKEIRDSIISKMLENIPEESKGGRTVPHIFPNAPDSILRYLEDTICEILNITENSTSESKIEAVRKFKEFHKHCTDAVNTSYSYIDITNKIIYDAANNLTNFDFGHYHQPNYSRRL